MGDIVIKAIQRKYASEVYDALATQEPVYMTDAPVTLRLPMTAEATVLHNKVGGNVVCEVRVIGGKEGSLNGAFIYSLEGLKQESDVVALAYHMCDRLKYEFAEKLLELLEKKP